MNVKGTSGIFANQTLSLNGGALVFGRNSATCNIVFPDNVRGISRMHCKVDNSTGVITLTDLGSSYGTYLNGAKLQSNMPMPLKNGDTFYLGDRSNSFMYEDPNAVSMMVPTPGMQAAPVTYVNSGMQAQVGASQSSKKGMILVASIAAVVILIVGALAISNYNSAQNAKQQAAQAQQQAAYAQQDAAQARQEASQARQEASQAQADLAGETNKDPIEKTLDAVGSWYKVFK